jgi:hypothetical protein
MLSVFVCVSSLLLLRRLLDTHVPTAAEELLDASFSMSSMSCQRKVGVSFFPELILFLYSICVSPSKLSSA